MYSIPLFYIFFCVLAISSIWIIVMRWKRYMKYSNGTYKNAGQDLIFPIKVINTVLNLHRNRTIVF